MPIRVLLAEDNALLRQGLERLISHDDSLELVGSVIDPTGVEQLVAANQGPRKTPLTTLTPRELEVLGEMAQGKSNAAIAATLVLSERAIEKHTNSIFAKLALTEERDLNRRVKAVLLYLHEHGTSA